MNREDPISTDYVLTRERFGRAPPRGAPGGEDRSVLLEFALYILLNLACAAMGLLIWIV